MVNDLGALRQISTLTVSTAVDETAYAMTMNGISVSTTSGTGTTKTAIRDALIAEFRKNQVFENVAAAQPSGTDGIRFTSLVPGLAFTLADTDANLASAVTVANVAQVHIPFGRGLVLRTGALRQVVDVTVSTAANSTAYALTINGTVVSYTSDGSATKAEIVAGLVAAIEASDQGAAVIARATGTDTLRIQGAVVGTAFTYSESDANLASVTTQANSIATVSTYKSASLPWDVGLEFVGVLERIHTNVDPHNAGSQYPYGAAAPGVDMTVGYRGMWVVETDVAVAAGDPIYLRCLGDAASIGKFRNSEDADEDGFPRAMLIPNAKFVETAPAGSATGSFAGA